MTETLAIFSVFLLIQNTYLAVMNNKRRKRIEELEEEIEDAQQAESDEGTDVIVEYASGELRTVKGIRKLAYEDSGIVLRSADGTIVANVNPKRARIICTETAFGMVKVEEATE